uniref:hypothetical protein n=1 Tax=Wolbachia endosymbiont of Cruorifilaria tuberocauda TaxID=1812111 RepID=UPI001FE68AD2|nr:hypothetical protein [Wolbachia endosymbiont of Cruorifilaria tuberocauda]
MDKLTCITNALSKIYCVEEIRKEAKVNRRKTIIIESSPEQARAHTDKNIHFLQSRTLFCISTAVSLLITD